jgi:putative chitinase
MADLVPDLVQVTPALLEAVAGKPVSNLVDRPLSAALNRWLPDYGVLASPRRLAHFLAQACHETAGFSCFTEKGSGDGPDADPFDDYLQKYDRRGDLGNAAPGDGEKYRGRGIFQLTGKANYRDYGERLGLDLLGDPGQAVKPEVSARVAGLFWSRHGLNTFADQDDCRGVTYRINGGYNGLADRLDCLTRAKHFLRNLGGGYV